MAFAFPYKRLTQFTRGLHEDLITRIVYRNRKIFIGNFEWSPRGTRLTGGRRPEVNRSSELRILECNGNRVGRNEYIKSVDFVFSLPILYIRTQKVLLS